MEKESLPFTWEASESTSEYYSRDARLSALDTERFSSTYERARAAMRQSGLTHDDIVEMTDKFWNMYFEGAAVVDTAAGATFSIHTNLCIGTIAPYAESQPQLRPLLEQLERFDVCGKYMLTEIGRGLDARNIETTATLSQDRTTLDLHSPSPAAAKSMPPGTPLGGIPKIAIVFAQLVVDGETRGVRAFVVHLTDGTNMCPGVSTKLLPQRPGCRPLDYAITTFNHCILDRHCLLGDVDKKGDKRSAFFAEIHRISVGSLALSLANVPALKAAAYLVYKFSERRMVTDPSSKLPVAILSFPTQYGPIVSATAHAAVMEAAGRVTIGVFQTPGVPEILRTALTCIFKATVTYTTQRYLNELTDRCGWRGLHGFNRISELQLALKGNSIAEGDVMVLCIRLASELLQGKYPLPPSDNPNTLLARHEKGLFDELQRFVTRDENGRTDHRSTTFAQNVTPRARDLIQAIGHRLAYDSVLEYGQVCQELIDVWEADCILEYASWYVEHAGMTNQEINQRRVLAIERAMPHLRSIIDESGMDKHFGETPLVSEQLEDEFLRNLPSFGAADAQSHRRNDDEAQLLFQGEHDRAASGSTHGSAIKEYPANGHVARGPSESGRHEPTDQKHSCRTEAQTWPLSKRVFAAATICLYTFVVYSASAIYIIGLPDIMREFQLGEQEALLGLSLYVFAYGLGPMLWAPLSELSFVGRTPVYTITFVAFLCFSVLAATAQSWKGYLVIRFFQGFFGSPCLANGGASMHDLFPDSTVPFSLAVWIAAAFCGPALGPILAGYVVPEKGWRMGMWETAYMAGPVCVLLLLLPETHEPTLAARKARAFGYKPGKEEDSENHKRRPGHYQALLWSLKEALIKPVQIAALDPSVTVANLYTMYIYGTYYTLFVAIPRAYVLHYGFSPGQLGLSFLFVFVACITAGLAYAVYIHKIFNPQLRRGRLSAHEERLRPALVACFLPPIGLLIFAWTSDSSIHWIVGLIGLTINAIGTFIILQCLSVYLPRIYPDYSASLFASNDLFRSSLAAGAIHFGVPLYDDLGIDRGVSILAAVSGLGIVGMFFIYWKGAALRASSRFAAPKQ